MSSVQLQPQIQDIKNQVTPAFYKTVKVQPNNNNVASFTTSQQTLQFEIAGNNVYNFSKFSISFLRGVLSGTVTAKNVAFIPNNYCPFFNKVECFTSSNVRLVDVNNAHIYSKMAGLLNIDFRENASGQGFIYTSNRSVKNIVGDGGQYPETISNGLASILVTSDPYVSSQLNSTTKTLDESINYRSYNSYSNVDATNVTVSNANIITASNFLGSRKYVISLSDLLPDSFFAIDKDIYISETMYIRLTLNQLSSVVFELSNSDGKVINTYGSILATPATSLAATNWTLLSYVQANEMVKAAVMQENETMSSVIMPFINMNNYTISSGPGLKGSIFKILASTLNSRLYKIYSLLYQDQSSFMNSSNINLSKFREVSTYETKYNYINLYFNNNFLIGLDVQSNDDLSHIQNQFKNNSFTDEISYKDNSVIAHVFDSQPVSKRQYDGVTIRGEQFPINNEHSINWQYQCLSTYPECTNYQCGIVLSEIYILKGRFSLNPFV